MFQSSPGLATGCNPSGLLPAVSCTGFQSSPGLATGCNSRQTRTLTGRVRFQSSPGLATGCNGAGGRRGPGDPSCFNPHPALRPGATTLGLLQNRQDAMVSILTRPCDRVQRCTGLIRWNVRAKFQSSPGLATGCNPSGLLPAVSCTGFQSSPGLATGCNWTCWATMPRWAIWFQSSPGLATGCNPHSAYLSSYPHWSFNPHPALRPGATGVANYQKLRPTCFNPHPALRPGATSQVIDRSDVGVVFQSSPGLATGCNVCNSWQYKIRNKRFQSSPGLATGCNDRWGGFQVGGFLVSILTRPCDRVQPSGITAADPAKDTFQSSPGLATGCNEWPELALFHSIAFQSSPGLATGCNA